MLIACYGVWIRAHVPSDSGKGKWSWGNKGLIIMIGEKADLPLGVPDMSSGNQLSAAKDRGMIQDIFIPNIQEDPTSLLNSKGFSSVEIDKDSKSPLKNESPSGDRIDDLANIFQQEFT
ncbi:hypothetical protein QYF36_019523 [Acer negundo]|nr:hypothetical protein QYF36_019523 [Acer negundo]